MADKLRSIEVVTRGLSGAVKVNGTQYNSVMPAPDPARLDVANVLTFVRNNWGNKGDAVTVSEVKKVRGGGASACGRGPLAMARGYTVSAAALSGALVERCSQWALPPPRADLPGSGEVGPGCTARCIRPLRRRTGWRCGPSCWTAPRHQRSTWPSCARTRAGRRGRCPASSWTTTT